VSYNSERVSPTTQASLPDNIGAFRTVCGYSHMSYDDPIVYPGQPGRAHLHTFFGNTGADAFSTVSSIAGTGNSTCRGGTINRSAYWIPSLIDTTRGAPIVPEEASIYYKSAYGGVVPSTVQPMPNGLRMIAGSASATTSAAAAHTFEFHCEDQSTGGHYSEATSIPNCRSGDFVSVALWFPQCWDGRNLDSPDHKSHMAIAMGSGEKWGPHFSPDPIAASDDEHSLASSCRHNGQPDAVVVRFVLDLDAGRLLNAW
jgi:Domain of unknown function (DUF1996)